MKHLAMLLLFVTAPAFAESGIYWTPVPAELAEYAVFAIPDVQVEEAGDDIHLEYNLPAELTGALNHIELTGTRGKGQLILTGPNARAVCPEGRDYSHCRVNYQNLNIDPTLRTELLKSISQTPNELILREAVAARFCAAGGGEPCGFLKVLGY